MDLARELPHASVMLIWVGSHLRTSLREELVCRPGCHDSLVASFSTWCLEQGRTSAWPDDIKNDHGSLAQTFRQLQPGFSTATSDSLSKASLKTETFRDKAIPRPNQR
jgi:hypothetical protein